MDGGAHVCAPTGHSLIEFGVDMAIRYHVYRMHDLMTLTLDLLTFKFIHISPNMWPPSSILNELSVFEPRSSSRFSVAAHVLCHVTCE